MGVLLDVFVIDDLVSKSTKWRKIRLLAVDHQLFVISGASHIRPTTSLLAQNHNTMPFIVTDYTIATRNELMLTVLTLGSSGVVPEMLDVITLQQCFVGGSTHLHRSLNGDWKTTPHHKPDSIQPDFEKHGVQLTRLSFGRFAFDQCMTSSAVQGMAFNIQNSQKYESQHVHVVTFIANKDMWNFATV